MGIGSADPRGAVPRLAWRILDDVTVASPSLRPGEVQMGVLIAYGIWIPATYIERRLKVRPSQKKCWACFKVGFHSAFRHWAYREVELPRSLKQFLETRQMFTGTRLNLIYPDLWRTIRRCFGKLG